MRRGTTFGGEWTEEKLTRLGKYLPEYTTILTKTPFYTSWYVDGFASGGYRKIRSAARLESGLFKELADEETQAFLKGSALKALEVNPLFDRYLFIDLNAQRCNELEGLKADYQILADRIQIINADANSFLKEWCASTNWRRNRALVFLDPYGMQVEWSLLEALAATKAVDLWLLFPLGAAVNRLLTKREPPPEKWATALTRTLGTDEWLVQFYDQKPTLTLFGLEERVERQAGLEQIGQFFIDRLKTIFAGVVTKPYVLSNSRNIPLYLLCFAVANPKPSVQGATLRIASHILTR